MQRLSRRRRPLFGRSFDRPRQRRRLAADRIRAQIARRCGKLWVRYRRQRSKSIRRPSGRAPWPVLPPVGPTVSPRVLARFPSQSVVPV